MASLARSSTIYIGAAALNAAVPFVVLAVLARWLGPAQFGVVGNYLALVNIAVVLAGLSVHGAISVIHFKQHPDDVPAHVRGALRLLLLTGLPLVLLLLVLGPTIERSIAIPARWAWTISVVAAGQFVVTLGLTVFQTREQPMRYGALQVSLTLGWGLLSLAFVGLLGMGWEGRAAAQLAAVVVVALVAIAWLQRDGLLAAASNASHVRTLLRFGLPLVPHSLAGALMAGADRLVLTGAADAEATGQYFAAYQICALLTVGAAAVNQAWVPWLYRRLADLTEANALSVVRITYLVYAVLLAGAGLLVLCAPLLIPLIAGPRYGAAVPLLSWLAPAAALSGMYYFVTNYLFFAGKTGTLSIITVTSSLLQLALMAVWVPRWGAQGAACAVLCTSLAYWLATWAAAQRITPLPWAAGLGLGTRSA